MADFLEERIDHQKIKMGASFAEQYAVNIVTASGGNEYRSLIHPFPARTFDISQLLEKSETFNYILALYHRAHGQYAGFRLRCYDEFSSNGNIGTPTAFDQEASLVSAGVYEMRKYYGTSGTAGASGYPHRKIKKPVAGTVKAAIGTVEMAKTAVTWDVDVATGMISFPTNGSGTITGISKAASAVITLGATSGSIYAGQSVHVGSVAGMTQINGQRALVTSVSGGGTLITIALDTTGYSTYASGGVINTRPQAGEQVTCGFEFDWPVRFNGSLVIGQDYPSHRNAEGIELIEILNP